MRFWRYSTWVITVTFVLGIAPQSIAGEAPNGKIARDHSRDQVRGIISRAAATYGVDRQLVEAIVSVESAFNPMALSIKGAMGLMQLMPQTASRYGVIDPFDPKQNVRGGILYLRDLLVRFDNLMHVLAAYNAGERAVEKYRGLPPYPETRNYVRKVMNLYAPDRRLVSSGSAFFVGQADGDVIRSLERAKKQFRDRHAWVRTPGIVLQARRMRSFFSRRSSGPKPVTEMTTGPLVESDPPRWMSLQLR